MEISEKNTKAEILIAYNELTEELERLKLAAGFDPTIAQAQEERIEEFEAEIERLSNELNETSSKQFDGNNDNVTVVIPYIKGFSQGNELQIALRGWAQNFKENFNIVIIGDSEEWMSDLVNFIPHERLTDNPPLDIAAKMMLAIESDLVSEKFIWANDDQYLITPCMLADMEILKCTGQLEEKNFGSSLYRRNKMKTLNLLKEMGKGTIDFSSHTPFVFEKNKLFDLIERFDLVTEPYLIASLYFNLYFPGFVPIRIDTVTSLEYDNIKIGVYRENADMDKMIKLMPRKKIVSNSENGWSDKFSTVINNVFKEKCRFEK